MKYILIFAALLISISCFGQESEIYDQVKMKDGSTLVGEIISYKSGGELELKLRSGQIVRLQAADVKSIGQYTVREAKVYEFRERGWYGSVQGNFITGNSGARFSGESGAQFLLGGGYQFNRWLGAGIESGYRQMVSGSGEQFAPLGLNLRGFALDSRLSPFYSVTAGYGFALDKEDPQYLAKEGGWYLEPALGLRLSAFKGANAYIKVSHIYQQAEYKYPNWIWPAPEPGWEGPHETHKLTYKRWTIGAGVMF